MSEPEQEKWCPSTAHIVMALNEVWGLMNNPEDVDDWTRKVCQWAHTVVDHPEEA